MTPNEPQQPTDMIAPLAASENLDELLDDDGQIAGSPANDEDDA